jgi:hypothetical protein
MRARLAGTLLVALIVAAPALADDGAKSDEQKTVEDLEKRQGLRGIFLETLTAKDGSPPELLVFRGHLDSASATAKYHTAYHNGVSEAGTTTLDPNQALQVLFVYWGYLKARTVPPATVARVAGFIENEEDTKAIHVIAEPDDIRQHAKVLQPYLGLPREIVEDGARGVEFWNSARANHLWRTRIVIGPHSRVRRTVTRIEELVPELREAAHALTGKANRRDIFLDYLLDVKTPGVVVFRRDLAPWGWEFKTKSAYESGVFADGSIELDPERAMARVMRAWGYGKERTASAEDVAKVALYLVCRRGALEQGTARETSAWGWRLWNAPAVTFEASCEGKQEKYRVAVRSDGTVSLRKQWF